MRIFSHLAAVVPLALAIQGAPVAARVVTIGRVFVERQLDDADRLVVATGARLSRGDRVIYVLSWRNAGDRPARGVTVVNPLPRAIAFQSAGRSGAQVSVDGGRSWGTLHALRVRDEDGAMRGARPEDVTHLRWRLVDAIPAGAVGRLAFRGVVR